MHLSVSRIGGAVWVNVDWVGGLGFRVSGLASGIGATVRIALGS